MAARHRATKQINQQVSQLPSLPGSSLAACSFKTADIHWVHRKISHGNGKKKNMNSKCFWSSKNRFQSTNRLLDLLFFLLGLLGLLILSHPWTCTNVQDMKQPPDAYKDTATAAWPSGHLVVVTTVTYDVKVVLRFPKALCLRNSFRQTNWIAWSNYE